MAGWTAFVLLIVNGRCGRGMTDLFSLAGGVDPYPLRVTTDVRVQGEPAEALVGFGPAPDSVTFRPLIGAAEPGPPDSAPGKMSETGNAARPAMWFVFEDPDDLRRFVYTTNQIWRLTTQPGSKIFVSDGITSKKELDLWVKEISKSHEPGRSSLPRRRYSYAGGRDLSLIGGNFDLFLEKAGGGWWREAAGGFFISVKAAIPEGRTAAGPDIRLEPSLFHFDRLDDACRLIGELTGVEVVNDVAQERPRTAAEPDEDFGADEDGGIHVEIERARSPREVVEAIARSRLWAVEEQAGRLVVRDLRLDEVARRARELMEARRSMTNVRFPDPSLNAFPSSSGPFVAAYLDDRDDRIIEYALEVLEAVGVEPALPDLASMMNTGATRSGRKVSDVIRRSAANILMKAGEEEALSFLMRSGDLYRYQISSWYEDRVAVAPAPGALDIQDKLLARFKTQRRLLRPGKLRIHSLPVSLSVADVVAAQRLALDALNAVSYNMFWDEDALATMTFSADGVTAKFRVELSHYWGPLAAGGSSDYAELRRVAGRWLVTWMGSGGSWIS